MTAPAVHLRRASDWSPIASVGRIVQDMPIPEPMQLRELLGALAKRLHESAPERYEVVVSLLGDVNDALYELDGAPQYTDCDGCAGSGTNRHVGGDCISCNGRGVAV